MESISFITFIHAMNFVYLYMDLDKLHDILRNTLGHNGRMISASKGGYRDVFPNHIPIFNANIIAKIGDRYEKLWYGDVDITIDENSIKSAALDGECELYILKEMDARFHLENNPNVSMYIYKTDGIESVLPDTEYCTYTRNEDGQLIKVRNT